MKENKCLNVYVSHYWQTVNPSLQNNALSVVVLRHQFESLVMMDENFCMFPQLAISWEISSDYKKYTFTIDNNRRFSDGEFLQARHVKDSLAYSLSVNPISSNLNTMDLLHHVSGSVDVRGIPKLEGIKILSDSIIEFEFKHPHRTVLQKFSASRYGIFKVTNEGKIIGTGPYMIENNEIDQLAILTPNPFYQKKNCLF